MIRSRTVDTGRLRMHLIESGPEAGIPVVLLHGNLSTGRFYEHLLPEAPDRYRLIAPDMRGFGDSERTPMDATTSPSRAQWRVPVHPGRNQPSRCSRLTSRLRHPSPRSSAIPHLVASVPRASARRSAAAGVISVQPAVKYQPRGRLPRGTDVEQTGSTPHGYAA